MTNFTTNLLPITIPLTATNHQTAEDFYQRHSDPQKAIQVYLNTLSVQAVHFYLTCLGIQTSLEKSQSWNPILQVLIDTADLWIEGLGGLECRPMLADAKDCLILPRSPDQRIGCIVVRFNSDLTEAELLGFASSIETENLCLEQLQSIDDLPEYLNLLALSQPAPVRLSDWFHAIAETGWKTLEMLIGEWQQPVLSFRTPINYFQVLESSRAGVKRGKLLALGAPEGQVLLLVEVTPTRIAFEYQIKLELYPVEEIYLPRSLHVSVVDEVGKTVLQAESSDSEGLEFQFSGELGEHFSVKISLQGCNWVETFEI